MLSIQPLQELKFSHKIEAEISFSNTQTHTNKSAPSLFLGLLTYA